MSKWFEVECIIKDKDNQKQAVMVIEISAVDHQTAEIRAEQKIDDIVCAPYKCYINYVQEIL